MPTPRHPAARRVRLRRGDSFDVDTSDVDVLAEFDSDRPGFDYFGTYFALKEGLEEILGRPADVVSATSIRNPYFLLYCVLVLAYFTLMEWRLGGTIGKLLLRVQVVDAGGGRISLQKSLVRNVLRIVDGFPFIFPYLVGLVVVASSTSRQRVGDKVARTLIVDRQQSVEQAPETVALDIPHQ